MRLSESPAAVFVISNEDIRRSGARYIPEILRMVPGLNVGRIDANKWAVSARGFNDRFANKMLVLIDGRSIYTPLFSGVYWDAQNVPLEDIDRIEVIRGPGATIWGANAVNGVINIVTKTAQATPGEVVHAGTGDEENGFGSFRIGRAFNRTGAFRIHGNFQDHGGMLEPSPTGDDSWRVFNGGGRLDWADESGGVRITFQGDVYDGTSEDRTTIPLLEPPYSSVVNSDQQFSGANILGRWEKEKSDGHLVRVQAYLDHTERAAQYLAESRSTLDLELFHGRRLGLGHDVACGLGFRTTSDRLSSTPTTHFDPPERSDVLFNAFIQDDMGIAGRNLHLTAGSKFEHNGYTGLEIQPSLRLWLALNRKSSMWASVSRAVRTSSRAEADIRVTQFVLPPGASGPGQPGIEFVFFGSDDYGSENLIAYETGWRSQAGAWLHWDVTAFLNAYDDLRTVSPGEPYPKDESGQFVVLPLQASNDLKGTTYGFECSTQMRLARWSRMSVNYSYLKADFEVAKGSVDRFAEEFNDTSPAHQLYVGCSADLMSEVLLDCALRHVSSVPALELSSYTVADARVGFRPARTVEIGLVGRNLLKRDHVEFVSRSLNTESATVGPEVYGTLTLRFR
jgi:iron complex outermembrane receptor protein